MKVLMKLPKYLEWTCLSDFEMRLTFVSDWGIVVLRFLGMADTLTCWITLLEWQKTGNPNVHTKWQWMVLLRIWSSCKNFQQNSWMRITIHLLIVVLAPATLCMEPLELVLENLDESLRSFWKVHTWFSTTPPPPPPPPPPPTREDYESITGCSTYPRQPTLCSTWYELFGLSLLYFKTGILYVLVKRVDLAPYFKYYLYYSLLLLISY